MSYINKLDFDSIRPYEDHEIHEVFERLKNEESFMNLISFLYPEIQADKFMNQLSNMTSIKQFQEEVVSLYVKNVLKNTSTGITSRGLENLDPKESYLFISNHRDIVLDPAILNILLFEHGFNTTEIAIGDNLLIFPWITDLVKLNRTFIVRRNLSARGIMESSRVLSHYIRHALNDKKHSVWIAQREGRSKDGNDRTQVSLLKMLNMSGKNSLIDNFKELKIVPVSISYELDPCDYLKAEEFYNKSINPDHAKTSDDDLKHMAKGLEGYKGRIHFAFGKPIQNELKPINALTIKNEQFNAVAELIDKHVHANYMLWPNNYIAWDQLNNNDEYKDFYTSGEKEKFLTYINDYLEKTEHDKEFIKNSLLEMYSNPLLNKLEK